MLSSESSEENEPSSVQTGSSVDVHSSEVSSQALCPAAAIDPEEIQDDYRASLRELLRYRLRMAVTLLLTAFALSMLRTLLVTKFREPLSGQTFLQQTDSLIIWWAYFFVVLFLGGMTALLFSKKHLRLGALRFLELMIYGVPALFLTWVQYGSVAGKTSAELIDIARAFPAQTVIPWLILIQLYGIFIPNRLKRAIVVIAIAAIIPILSTVAIGFQHSEIAQVLYRGGLSAMVLWMTLGAVAAIYGSNRLGHLRRENFAAKQIGAYNLNQKIGSGGMGDVYLAEHHLLKRPCAIKLIQTDLQSEGKAISRFESEVQATAQLTHPNTIAIYDYGHTEEGIFYYAMEYLPGLTLQEMVDSYGALPPDRLVHLLVQVCGALREAHSFGMIHRDIKPGNIIAAERGGLQDVAKLLDFGLVKSIHSNKQDNAENSIDGAIVGSPHYAAPEVTMGEQPDERTDIYSLGATAFFLLTGQPLFPGNKAIQVLFAHVNDTPPSPRTLNADIPADLEAVILKAIEKKPEDRYGSVVEFAEALDNVACRLCWTQQKASTWWEEKCTSRKNLLEDRRTPALEETVFMRPQVEEAV